MSYPEYTSGYWYPNNFAEAILWSPLIIAYVLTVAGYSSLFIAYVTYILGGRLREKISIMLIVGLPMFLVLLLGPLADARAPDNAWRMMVSPRVLPSEAIPGFSIMAFNGAITWSLIAIVSIIFTLLYFSYPSYLKYLETRNPIHRILSLGVTDEGKYAALEKPLKILAFLGSILIITWLVYPATLFMQMSHFVWVNSHILPLAFAVEELLKATGIDLLVIILFMWVVMGIRPGADIVKPFTALIAVTSAVAIIVLFIQAGIWYVVFGDSPYYAAFEHLHALLGIALILYLVALVAAFLSRRYILLSIVAALAGTVGAIINKWNFLVKVQEVSINGLGIVEGHVPLIVIAGIVGIFFLGIFLVILLGSIFPVGFEVRRGEAHEHKDQ